MTRAPAWQEWMMQSVANFLATRANGHLLAWSDQVELMNRFDLTCAQAEGAILEAGFLPNRYRRNQGMLTTAQQRDLFRSTVAVVGCGGLGGYVLEELARLGVGGLVAIDADVFQQHNLNRQLFSAPSNIGENKARIAALRIRDIHPGGTVRAVGQRFCATNAAELLAGAHVVVDAVDSVATRLELGEIGGALNIPVVHGAIAGWYGHVATVMPGDDTIRRIYSRWTHGPGAESDLGNPAFTPAVVASLQVAEVCKLLLGLPTLRQHELLCVNLLDMQCEKVLLT
jgi:molybdopterin/thiamine biosynthesis adenylyltransferase